MANNIYLLISKESTCQESSDIFTFNDLSFAESHNLGTYNSKDIIMVRTELDPSFFASTPEYLAASDLDLAYKYPDIAKLVFTVTVNDNGKLTSKKLGDVSDLSTTVGQVLPPIVYAE